MKKLRTGLKTSGSLSCGAKRIARRAIYKAKIEAEKARFATIHRRDDEKK